MIKTVEVICTRSIRRGRKDFNEGKSYRGYMKDGRFLLQNNGHVIDFDVHTPGHLRTGDECYFHIYFDLQSENYTQNKTSLREYLANGN